MLIKFFSRGTGSGAGPVDYLMEEEGREDSPPEILWGDPSQTRDLIDSIDRKHRYTSGVLSFAPEDQPSEAEQEHAIGEFERAAFAGLKKNQYDILWVRHTHTQGGRVELHFVTPRVELGSGKALNIAPPGWKSLYDPLRDALNTEHGWARPPTTRRGPGSLSGQRRGFQEHPTGKGSRITFSRASRRAMRETGPAWSACLKTLVSRFHARGRTTSRCGIRRAATAGA